MVAALIISICVAIIFLGLFISERSSSEEFRKEISGQKKAFDRLRDELMAGKGNDVSGHLETADGHEARKLTGELVSEALKYNGYVPNPEEGYVLFMIQGERYFIRTDNLPYMMLDKPYSIDPGKYDMALLRKAAGKVTDELFIGKVSITDDGETLRFQADAYEPSYGHFRDAIGCYLGVIHETQKRLHDVYDEMVKEKENQKELASYGFHSGESLTGENKVLS